MRGCCHPAPPPLVTAFCSVLASPSGMAQSPRSEAHCCNALRSQHHVETLRSAQTGRHHYKVLTNATTMYHNTQRSQHCKTPSGEPTAPSSTFRSLVCALVITYNIGLLTSLVLGHCVCLHVYMEVQFKCLQ